MPRYDLEALGMTDDELNAQREEIFGPLRDPDYFLASDLPDNLGLAIARREVFDAVCALNFWPTYELVRLYRTPEQAFYTKRAKSSGHGGTKTGAVTVVQRTSSDL